MAGSISFSEGRAFLSIPDSTVKQIISRFKAMRGGYIVAVLQHAFLNYFTGKTTKMYFVIKDLLLRILQLEQLSERICSINIRENKNKIQ